MKLKSNSLGLVVGLALMASGCASVGPSSQERADLLLEKEQKIKSTEADPGWFSLLYNLWPVGWSPE
jgi:hypothetical protein